MEIGQLEYIICYTTKVAEKNMNQGFGRSYIKVFLPILEGIW